MDSDSFDTEKLLLISSLIEKHVRKELTEDEKSILTSWIREDEANQHLFDKAINEHTLRHDLSQLERIDVKSGWQRVLTKQEARQTTVVRTFRRQLLKYAAIVLLPVSLVALYFIQSKNHTPEKIEAKNESKYHNDVLPGGNKAILTLSDGRVIELDDQVQGDLGVHDGISIRNDSAVLTYETTGEVPTTITHNTFTTPKGGAYKLVLSDGTKVWLNAMSSIKYPTRFVGSSRIVQITGEAYFEVARAAEKRFIVQTHGGVNIEVLGTHFNVMAYPDEDKLVTSLLEGKVQVKREGHDAVYPLKPGFSAVFDKRKDQFSVVKSDVDASVAWTNNIFLFDSANLKDIMRRLERWYDVKVEYRTDLKLNNHFTGGVRRNQNISKVLEMLEMTGGVKFEVIDNKVIVLQ
jgi:transmembrane sensor